MSMEHKAFLFDHDRFEQELRPVLERALAQGTSEDLKRFIVEHLQALKDPYEGLPLDEDWEDLLEFDEPDQYGDFALTKYYDPAEDFGLGSDWISVQEVIESRAPGASALLLGKPLRGGDALFDPGKMGAYFCSPDDVREGLRFLQGLTASGELPEASAIAGLFGKAASAGDGLYITF
jgi:hypothetical protein